MPHYYAINFEIDSDWGVLTINTPGVAIGILHGEDSKTSLNPDGTKLSWGTFESHAYGKQSFDLTLKSDNALQNLRVTTEHGWDESYVGDKKGQITLTTLAEQVIDTWKPDSDGSCLRHFTIKLSDTLPIPRR